MVFTDQVFLGAFLVFGLKSCLMVLGGVSVCAIPQLEPMYQEMLRFNPGLPPANHM